MGRNPDSESDNNSPIDAYSRVLLSLTKEIRRLESELDKANKNVDYWYDIAKDWERVAKENLSLYYKEVRK